MEYGWCADDGTDYDHEKQTAGSDDEFPERICGTVWLACNTVQGLGIYLYIKLYQDFDMLDDMQKQLYREGMAAFGGIAPTYHIELLERPTIVWDFHSLLLGVQMMFSFMLTDEKSSLKVCKHCGKAFVASRPNSVFCSGKCKNRYNVYKSRAKDKDNTN